MNPRWTLALLLAVGAPLAAQQDPPAPPAPADRGKQDPGKDDQARPKVPLEVGDMLPPDVKLKDKDGKDFVFAEQKGKVVFVHFWSFRCPWEKVAEPKLNKLAEDCKDQDFVAVAINANSNEIGKEPNWEELKGKEDADPYADFAEHLKKVNHTVLFDHSGDVGRLFGAKTTPHCFVIDKTGKLVYAGGLDNDGREVDLPKEQQYARLAIEAALAGKEVERPTSKPYG